MEVTCSCGKKLFFTEEDEEQTCDRCGGKVRRTGVPVEDVHPKSPPPSAREARARGGRPTGVRHRDRFEDDEPGAEQATAPLPPPGRPRFSTRVKLIIAGGRRSRKGLGCLVFLLAVVAGLLAADYYHFNRPGGLICGHVGKSSYLFGMIPFGHDCEGMKALRYLDRARRALMKPSVVVRNFDGLMKLPGVGEPPEGTPYEFTLPGQDYLAADPIEPDSPHYHYLVAPDGTVYSEKDEEASPESPKLGSLGP